MLLDLPDELLVHIAMRLVAAAEPSDAQHFSFACRNLHEKLQAARTYVAPRVGRHELRWFETHRPDDVVIRSGGRGLKAAADRSWRRAYGRPLTKPAGIAQESFAVRIDQTYANQGMLQIGVSLVQRTGACEWSVSPFYGRLVRRSWDRDGNLICAATPPDAYPDGHLKHVLVDEQGEPTRLEGRVVGRVVEVIYDHVAGTLAFALDGGEAGPALEGFPTNPSFPLRPVVGFRFGEDQVTIRCAPRLRSGWPAQENAVRERDARGVAAALALRERPQLPGSRTSRGPASMRVVQMVQSARLRLAAEGGGHVDHRVVGEGVG